MNINKNIGRKSGPKGRNLVTRTPRLERFTISCSRAGPRSSGKTRAGTKRPGRGWGGSPPGRAPRLGGRPSWPPCGLEARTPQGGERRATQHRDWRESKLRFCVAARHSCGSRNPAPAPSARWMPDQVRHDESAPGSWCMGCTLRFWSAGHHMSAVFSLVGRVSHRRNPTSRTCRITLR